MDAPVLFLDFDGVLHSSDLISASHSRGALFVHAAWLAEALSPYPALRIVLSTQWGLAVSPIGARSHLPEALQSRVVGHTLDLYRDHESFQKHSRAEQILRYVKAHHIRFWLAVDDDYRGWPLAARAHFMRTDSRLGLGDPLAQTELLARIALLYRHAEQARIQALDTEKQFARTFPELPRLDLMTQVGLDAQT